MLKPKVPVHRLVFHEITKEAIHAALDIAARHRRRPGAGPGNAAHPRPAVRLRSLAAVVAEGAAEAFGRPRAERGRAADRRARAASGWRSSRPPSGICSASSPRRTASSSKPSWSRSTAARFRPARISTRPPASSRTPRLLLLDGAGGRELGRADSQRRVPRDATSKTSRTPRKPYAAVHHQHAAAGSQPQARLHRPAHDAGGPEPVRKRPHHLHAYRLDQPGRRWRSTTPARLGARRSTATSICPPSRACIKSKVKNAQEAHEAIRPAGHPFELPEALRSAARAPTSSSSST